MSGVLAHLSQEAYDRLRAALGTDFVPGKSTVSDAILALAAERDALAARLADAEKTLHDLPRGLRLGAKRSPERQAALVAIDEYFDRHPEASRG